MSKKSKIWLPEWDDEKEILGLTESAVFPDHVDKENYKPRSLVDQTLEAIDPTPNVHTLFVQFNEKFFDNVLLSVEVKWSTRMTTCAGICSFHPRNRQCVISLSAPLLKLRPRKDLVETLLHEMIHGYLFLTNNNRDRDGHGPEFCKHMERINRLAGTKITIYHTFHDEVRLYKQHWWRCNGPCQKRAPYFGTVRRAMNRAPGPSDFWWKQHQASCNGEFIKIKEPEKQGKQKSKENNKSLPISTGKVNKSVMTPKSTSNSSNNSHVTGFSDLKSGSSPVGSSNFFKLGTTANKVHGFGTGGPGSTSGFTPSISSVPPQNTKTKSTSSCSGVLGGAGTGISNLLDKFSTASTSLKTNTSESLSLLSPPRKKKKQNSLAIFLSPTLGNKNENPTSSLSPEESQKRKKNDDSIHFCPICNAGFLFDEINAHVDKCLLAENHPELTDKINTKPPKMNQTKKNSNSQSTLDGYLNKNKNDNLSSDQICEKQKSHCVVCNALILISKMSDHLDICLKTSSPKKPCVIEDGILEIPDSDDDDIFELPEQTTPSNQSANENEEKFFICLVCNELVSKDIPLEVHLESCIHGIYEDFESDAASPVKFSSNHVGKYPCPVCMTMISEEIMNQHLDTCIQ